MIVQLFNLCEENYNILVGCAMGAIKEDSSNQYIECIAAETAFGSLVKAMM